jgi:hypothetical protein
MGIPLEYNIIGNLIISYEKSITNSYLPLKSPGYTPSYKKDK